MGLNSFPSALVVVAALGLASLNSPALAETDLKVQTSFNAGDVSYRVLTDKWAPKLEEMSEGGITIELLPIGSVVPHRETMQAVAAGILDGDLTSTSYFSGLDRAFALLGDLTAGYDTPDQLTAFCREGGGRELLQEAIDKYSGGVQIIGCAPIGRESLISGTPIRTFGDLKGLKIRAPEGLASEVFSRAGATPVAIPASEIYTAIEKGIVDAADGSNYATDRARGLHKVAKYPLYPGIHSMPIQQFSINQDVWDELGADGQDTLRTWFQNAFANLQKTVQEQDLQAVNEDKAGSEITVIDWSQEDRDQLRAVAQEAWADYAQDSELAQKAYDINIEFMKKNGMLE